MLNVSKMLAKFYSLRNIRGIEIALANVAANILAHSCRELAFNDFVKSSTQLKEIWIKCNRCKCKKADQTMYILLTYSTDSLKLHVANNITKNIINLNILQKRIESFVVYQSYSTASIII